jgi:hypothetical protein
MSETVSTEIAQSGCKDNENSFISKHPLRLFLMDLLCILKSILIEISELLF